jgi:hypothetical protein
MKIVTANKKIGKFVVDLDFNPDGSYKLRTEAKVEALPAGFGSGDPGNEEQELRDLEAMIHELGAGSMETDLGMTMEQTSAGAESVGGAWQRNIPRVSKTQKPEAKVQRDALTSTPEQEQEIEQYQEIEQHQEQQKAKGGQL